MNQLEDLINRALLDHEDEVPEPVNLLEAVAARSRHRRRIHLVAGTALAAVAATAITAIVAATWPPSGARDIVTVSAAGADGTARYDCPGLLPERGWPRPTPGATPMNEPHAEALAHAVGDLGQTPTFAAVYGTVIVDQPYGRVVLCVTDLARGRELVAAAKRADPSLEPSRLDLFRCRFSEQQGRAAMDQVMGRNAGYSHPVYSVAFNDTASGLEVTTDAAGARSTSFRAELEGMADGLPVTLSVGKQPKPWDLTVPTSAAATSQPPLPDRTTGTATP